MNISYITVNKIAAALVFSTLMQGCLSGPDFKTPEPPAAVPNARAAQQPAPDNEELAQWWKSFDDPVLTKLINKGLENSLTLKQAVSRITQSRAALRQTTSSLVPSASASARQQNSKTWNPDDSSNGASAGIDASWELDLFGGVRRNREASAAELEAAGYSLEDAKVSLTAEIASEYIGLRRSQADYDTAIGNLEIQTKSAAIAKAKADTGFGRGLDAISAETQIETLKAQFPLLEAEITASIRRIEVLTGDVPGTLDEILTPHAPVPVNANIAKTGIPSDLLKRRPDVRKAEASLHAATARIGVAQADRFPKLTIGGGASISADSLSSWSEALKSLSLTPALSIPLYSGGAKKAKVEQYRAAAEESAYAYRATVLSALSEADTAWKELDCERNRREAVLNSLSGSEKTLQAATRLYENGETEFQDVLTYQKSLLSAQQTLNAHNASLAQYSVKLYKAFGGGN